MQDQSTNPSQMYLSQTDTQGHTLPHANHMPPMYSPQPANPPLTQIYLSQPTNLSYFPRNQEQYLDMRRPTTSLAQQQSYNLHISRSISTSEDEEDDTHMDQEIPWQTVKGTKRKKEKTQA
jgi:hypothetical protein